MSPAANAGLGGLAVLAVSAPTRLLHLRSALLLPGLLLHLRGHYAAAAEDGRALAALLTTSVGTVLVFCRAALRLSGRPLPADPPAVVAAAAGMAGFDPAAFTQARLDAIGMPAEIAMRHATPHFAHVFAGEGYAAGYYSYLWSETLDADAFDAFLETGDAFSPQVAERLRRFIYAAGGAREPDDAYVAFRGRLPTAEALLRKRGLIDA